MYNELKFQGVADIVIPAVFGLVPGFSLGTDVNEDDMYVRIKAQGVLTPVADTVLFGIAIDGVLVDGVPCFKKVNPAGGDSFSFEVVAKLTQGAHKVQLHASAAGVVALDTSAFRATLSWERISNNATLNRHLNNKELGGSF